VIDPIGTPKKNQLTNNDVRAWVVKFYADLFLPLA
jgi:hypothetical protein